MNTRGLLDQLLKSGQDLLQSKTGTTRPSGQQQGIGGLGDLLGKVVGGGSSGASGGISGGNLGGFLSGAGGGALAAGAMGLLLV